ncbi:hypothetical protein BH23ACT10_BH23ACT10_21720 [soil metagenome]
MNRSRGTQPHDTSDLASSDEPRYRDVRTMTAAAPASTVFAVVCAIGGERGWPSYNWAWRLRGLVDRAIGGVGLRRGRRNPHTLRAGDPLDFWRVTEVRAPGADTPGVLQLRAEMRLPGDAWLEFRVTPHRDGATLRQQALYAPSGLFGRLYWWVMLPFHGMIFPTMAANLVRAAERVAATSSGAPTAPPAARDDGRAAADRGRRRARRAG